MGRTKVLRTTPNFADYFNLSHETPAMKKQLEHIFENLKTQKESGKAHSTNPVPKPEVSAVEPQKP
jgi:hypothetical protein